MYILITYDVATDDKAGQRRGGGGGCGKLPEPVKMSDRECRIPYLNVNCLLLNWLTLGTSCLRLLIARVTASEFIIWGPIGIIK